MLSAKAVFFFAWQHKPDLPDSLVMHGEFAAGHAPFFQVYIIFLYALQMNFRQG